MTAECVGLFIFGFAIGWGAVSLITYVVRTLSESDSVHRMIKTVKELRNL